MKDLKIAIVGAGICGLYLAWKLAEKGYQVTIFEKKGKIGKEACSGLFSERILKFIPESQKLIQNQIDSCLINFPKKTVTLRFSKKFLVISHFELDNLVANLAERTGAKIILNHPVNSLPEGFDRIIGCDGPNSIVRKKLGLAEPTYRLAILGFFPQEDYSGLVETWPIKQGFIWKIAKGKETEYGIIAGPQEAQQLFEKFLKQNNLELERMKSAIVPQGFLLPTHSSITQAIAKCEDERSSSTTLCGDAAGLTKPWSGGGVIWGLTAADILLKNFPDFLKYKNAMKKFFLPKILFSKIATKMVYFLGFKTPWFLPKNVKIESDFLF